MAGIMFAANNNGLRVARELDEGLMSELYGVKSMTNDDYGSNGDRIMYPGAMKLFKRWGAQNLMLDTRLAYDTVEEMVKSVDMKLLSLTPSSPRHEAVLPNLMSVDYSMPDPVLEKFCTKVGALGITPVIVVPTSRYTEKTFVRLRQTAEELVESTATFCATVGATVMCGCLDAHIVDAVNSSVPVIGLGGILTLDEPTHHKRPGLISETREFVDVFAIGSPLSDSHDPSSAVRDRLQAASLVD